MWTRKAMLLTGLGLTLVALGVVRRSPGVLCAGTVLVAFVLVNRILFSRGAKVHAERDLEMQRVYEGDGTSVRVKLANPGRRLVFVEARDRLPRQLKVEKGASYAYVALPAGGEDELRYDVNGPMLGVYEIGPTDVRLEDPFGLFHEERSLGSGAPFWVLPRREDLRKAALTSNLPMPLLGDHQVNRPGDGFDFFALREYAPGDTLRSVNWKASARSGKMMVNQMMRTTAAEVLILHDARGVTAAGPEDRSPRVVLARACASLVELAYAKRDNARLILYSDHVRELEPQPADRMIPLVLETMAELQPKGDFPLRLAVSQALPSLKPKTPVLILSPLVDDPTVVEAVSILMANDMIVAVITPRPISLPGIEPTLESALMAERQALLQELRGFGAVVIELEPGASLAATMEKGRLLVQ